MRHKSLVRVLGLLLLASLALVSVGCETYAGVGVSYPVYGGDYNPWGGVWGGGGYVGGPVVW